MRRRYIVWNPLTCMQPSSCKVIVWAGMYKFAPEVWKWVLFHHHSQIIVASYPIIVNMDSGADLQIYSRDISSYQSELRYRPQELGGQLHICQRHSEQHPWPVSLSEWLMCEVLWGRAQCCNVHPLQFVGRLTSYIQMERLFRQEYWCGYWFDYQYLQSSHQYSKARSY